MSHTYVSLFTGAGGLDIGLERAGFHAETLCEIDATFCETIRGNTGWTHADGRSYFGSAVLLNADVRDVAASDLFAGDDLDLLVGGPPCQAFSSSGKQLSVLDPRGTLVLEFCRLVDELKPKAFLFENVRGLVTARNRAGEPGGVITELLAMLEEIGYSCRSALLNSADYGSFQRRTRCFILGSRCGQAPAFPEPTHRKGKSLFEPGWRTPEAFLQEHADPDCNSYTYPTARLAEQLRDLPDGSGVKSPGKAEATRPGGHWGYRQGTFIADLTLPARTVTGSSSQDWVRWNGELCRLTLDEAKLLQGFPGDWLVAGGKTQRYKQVGNAVPAVFGESIGRTIARHLEAFPSAAPVRIDLPDSFRGYMDYTRRDHERNRAARSIHRHFVDGQVGGSDS